MLGRALDVFLLLSYAILRGCESLHLAREQDPYCGVLGLVRDPFGAEDRLNDTLAHCDKETSLSVINRNLEPRKPRKQVLWVHLHKMGGSFVRHEAQRQGERLPDDHINGNWMPDFCSTNKSERILCEQRAHRKDVTWSHIERELDADDFCDQTILGTMLRDPLASVASVLPYDVFNKTAMLHFLREGEGYIPPSKKAYRRKPWEPACLPEWDTYQHFDNFATRVLGHAYLEPPGTIGQFHLNIAKQNLKRFSTVIILEEVDKHVSQFKNAFGWELQKFSGEPKNHLGGDNALNALFDKEDIAFLQRLNAIDYELYAFGKELANQMTLDALRNLH